MITVLFQSHEAAATSPTGSEYNHALASHGGVASTSGSGGGTSPGRAIDGDTSTYWQSGSTTGWLSVQFAAMAYVNEIHIHFRTVVYSSLSVYFDTNANGAYEASEKLLKPIRGIESGLHDAIIGLMLLGAATAIKLALGTTLLGAILLVALDAFALYKELSGLGDVIAITGRGGNLVRGAYPFLYPVTLALNVVGIATTASDLAGDSAVFAKKLTGG